MRDRRARLAGPAGIGTCRPPPSDLSSGDTTLGAGRRHQSHRPLALSGEVGAVDAEAPRLDQRREEVQHVGGGSCRGGGGGGSRGCGHTAVTWQHTPSGQHAAGAAAACSDRHSYGIPRVGLRHPQRTRLAAPSQFTQPGPQPGLECGPFNNCATAGAEQLTSHSVPNHQWGGTLRAGHPDLHSAKSGGLNLQLGGVVVASQRSIVYSLPEAPACQRWMTRAAAISKFMCVWYCSTGNLGQSNIPPH